MENYSAIRNINTHDNMEFTTIIVSIKSKHKRLCTIRFYLNSLKGKSTGTGNRSYWLGKVDRVGLGLVATLLWRESSTSRERELWRVMIMLTLWIVITLSWIQTCVETNPIVYCKYMQFAIYQLCLNKAGKIINKTKMKMT